MASISMITLMTTIILIATIITIIFAVTVYIISRRKRRKNIEEDGARTINIVKTEGSSSASFPVYNIPAKKVVVPARPKILKLYNPFKENEEQKNGSEKS